MSEPEPLVSVGIPTYNRASLLPRSIDSVLNQDYANLEIIISDNASTDSTAQICQAWGAREKRIRYVRRPHNTGPTDNYREVLTHASGAFFMWLGDDDWIDPSYVRTCVEHLSADSRLALAGGVPKYYRGGVSASTGHRLCLPQDTWWRRVLSYYRQVSDNGTFYGLMRTVNLRHVALQNTMGLDWLLIAAIAARGKVAMLPHISVHREIGGLTTSYAHLVATFRLRPAQALFPMLSIAIAAWVDLVTNGVAYNRRPAIARLLVACAAFVVIATKPAAFHLRRAWKGAANFRSPAP